MDTDLDMIALRRENLILRRDLTMEKMKNLKFIFMDIREKLPMLEAEYEALIIELDKQTPRLGAVK